MKWQVCEMEFIDAICNLIVIENLRGITQEQKDTCDIAVNEIRKCIPQEAKFIMNQSLIKDENGESFGIMDNSHVICPICKNRISEFDHMSKERCRYCGQLLIGVDYSDCV